MKIKNKYEKQSLKIASYTAVFFLIAGLICLLFATFSINEIQEVKNLAVAALCLNAFNLIIGMIIIDRQLEKKGELTENEG